MQRILVLRGGALGDFIITLPALQALRQMWPTAQIDFVGNATAAALARDRGTVDRVESQHAAPWHQLYSGELSANFRERLARYNLVISFWPDPDGELTRLFPLTEHQHFVFADATPQTTPAARHFNSVVGKLTGLAISDWVRLHEPNPQSDVVAIHPGSGSPRKNWPFDRWLKVTNWLRDTARLRPVFILGEVEDSIATIHDVETWRNLPLTELTTRLSRSRLYLGHDTGVSHLAGACCRAGLVLFGPTNPSVWAPPNPQFLVLSEGDTLDAISVDQVIAKLTSMLAGQT